MRSYILVNVFIILSFQTIAQNEMDINCMKRIKEFCTGINLPKFTGLIVVAKDTIQFDSCAIIIDNTNSEIRKIFELGLVFPDLIFGASTSGDKFEFKKHINADTLRISSISELHLSKQKAGTKCFSFLLWQKMRVNPALYIFEITNEAADSKTDMKSFIEKAKVTAFGFCSVLI